MATVEPADLTRTQPSDSGVYVHVPYCRRRCPYCDFYFEVRAADADFPAAVRRELAARASEATGPARTLSFGGGTPTALPARALAALVQAVRETVGLRAGAEISLEANPEDITPDLAAGLVAGGFTRASVGVQSFNDDVLRYLGRGHNAAEAARSIAALTAAGMQRVAVDLIVGVPGEGGDRLEDDVRQARTLGATHVSAYLLTLEEGTPLVQLIASKKRGALDDDKQADAYEAIQQLLPAHGFAQYEVSSYAVPGHESVHNRLYWARAPYLGVGPGAHSCRVAAGGTVTRRHTTARLTEWLADPALAASSTETLDPMHAAREALAFGLRDLKAGIDPDAIARAHGTDDVEQARVGRVLHAAEQRGDVARTAARARLTAQGARFADRVARALLNP